MVAVVSVPNIVGVVLEPGIVGAGLEPGIVEGVLELGNVEAVRESASRVAGQVSNTVLCPPTLSGVAADPWGWFCAAKRHGERVPRGSFGESFVKRPNLRYLTCGAPTCGWCN